MGGGAESWMTNARRTYKGMIKPQNDKGNKGNEGKIRPPCVFPHDLGL
jgi:hypothetical protein